jgi:hypothetical protein
MAASDLPATIAYKKSGLRYLAICPDFFICLEFSPLSVEWA